MKYYFEAICDNCSNKVKYPLLKLEAAFQSRIDEKLSNYRCSNCGFTRYRYCKIITPSLDREILDVWASDPTQTLFFMEQDEELLLADEKYFYLILDVIDHSRYPKEKIDILIESICILLYDNTVSSNDFSEEENQKRKIIADSIRPELTKRKERILQAGDAVMEYIQEIVYPQIGIQ